MTEHIEGSDEQSPIREILADPNFRAFWIAQVLYSAANGTLRFTFVWLVVTLTDWSAAEALVAIALGLPAMFLSVPAGAWSDRVNRKHLFIQWTSVTCLALGLFTLAIAAEVVTTAWTAVAALVIGIAITINMPNVGAMVPLLVPKERLMNAIAIQNGGSQAASFVGLAGGGLAISLFGDAGGFGLLTVVMFAALLLMLRVTIPSDERGDTAPPSGMFESIKQGARFGFSSDPLRTMLLLAMILGSSFSVMQISMPRVVEETYGKGAGFAGVVLGAFGMGMLISSIFVARRQSMPHGRNVAMFIGIGLGMGQFLVSFAPNAPVAILVMMAWGINAGVAIASHRTLAQTHTPPEMMGRIMGLLILGFSGGLPIGAAASGLLVPWLGGVNTMRIVGVITMCLTIPLTWRRKILNLT